MSASTPIPGGSSQPYSFDVKALLPASFLPSKFWERRHYLAQSLFDVLGSLLASGRVGFRTQDFRVCQRHLSDLAVPRDKPANVRKLKAWHFGHESGYIVKSQDLPTDKQQEKRSE